MQRTIVMSFVLSLFAVTVSFAQVDGERLLPASVTREVATSWKQDGRVLEIEISNPKTSPVLTSLSFDLQYEPLPPRAFTAAPPPSKSSIKRSDTISNPKLDLDAGMRYLSEIEAKAHESIKVAIQPGSKLKTQIELKQDRTLITFVLREARGRDQTAFERLKSSVF